MAEERKLVTVLFADIVGSTSLGSENEPEVVRDVMARYFERMRDVAEKPVARRNRPHPPAGEHAVA